MSLFDQFNYEEDFSPIAGGGGGGGYGGGGYGGGGFDDGGYQDDEPYSSSGVVTARLEDEEPLFRKTRVDLQVPPSQTITHVVCASNVLLAALSSNILVRTDGGPQSTGEAEHIDLGRKPGDSLQGLFMDDSGTHIIAW